MEMLLKTFEHCAQNVPQTWGRVFVGCINVRKMWNFPLTEVV